MPLPEGKITWPPGDIAPYVAQAEANTAWWSGNLETLKGTAAATNGRRRFWHRRRPGDKTKATAQLHAPLAGDIAAVSAELLFGDNVTFETDDTTAQSQWEILEDTLGIHNILLEGAETAAAGGGCYLRAAWDTTIADHPLTQVYPQTHAIPDFKYGHLRAVTLWEDVYLNGREVWRHLERHEPGLILHGLYVGGINDLGVATSLAAHPATAQLVPELILPGRLQGRLLIDYVPNVRPNRRLPAQPIGRADWDGAEDFLDALDETWTSLMRDYRIGQARMVVPDEWVKAAGVAPGGEAVIDVDDEIVLSLHMPDSANHTVTTYQPLLRVQEHIAGTVALTERIVSAAGYSPQTFGLRIEGSAESGTALRVREGKTDKTIAKKQGYWAPGLRSHAQLLLDVGAEVFGTATITDPATTPMRIEFPEAQLDPVDLATMIQTLRTAEAISVRTGVTLAQPHLDENQVEEELARIKGDTPGLGMADPAGLFQPTPPAGGVAESPPGSFE